MGWNPARKVNTAGAQPHRQAGHLTAQVQPEDAGAGPESHTGLLRLEARKVGFYAEGYIWDFI